MSLVNPTLVLNCGSSSIKYALISEDGEQRIEGLAEALGNSDARIKHKNLDGSKVEINIPNSGAHAEALQIILGELIAEHKPVAVGHRVVHGGDKFKSATIITPEVLATIEELASLAPLHNPANAAGIKAINAIYPDLPQVAIFDTAFHQTMPAHAYRYAVPKELYTEHQIRRYGFHGTSHAYVSNRAATLSAKAGEQGWLVAHLGNGCSATAVYNGKSQDTSMGITPLEGLMMGTRSGDIDPSFHLHIHRTLGLSIEEIDTLLNKKSGLLGVSGVSNDMRLLEQAEREGNVDAILALEMFAYRTAKCLLGLTAGLPALTGIAFTGGVGENGADMRAKIVAHLKHLGAKADTAKNAELFRGAEGSFHAEDSAIELWVIPTDEEFQIASESRAVLGL
ncbi:acetate kinase [Moraxella caviae]|uniref:Acetate kinase n=1 Tax=Moraxella caviae TaxID=34060 RepID=A0A1S9ZZC5_9GAMM|nr:acetate kinase [Moraxella caviae]OOR88856.1 acetate kinase [Moraxella caviae]STZ10219.1 Acetate kinase [Moraxella caviae]VEW12390.1 Acetate kinase [Moraxella caviae]